jgi:catechol 2,3-dioxygenase-like lactoylglutathione lyase family enzyme
MIATYTARPRNDKDIGMRVHHLAFRTRDLARLRAFYEGVLGLAPVREQPGYSVWLVVGEGVLMLEQADAGEAVYESQTLDLTAFSVDEAGRARVRAALAGAGVALDGETAFTTYFRDPDGRRIAVSTYPLPEVEKHPGE